MSKTSRIILWCVLIVVLAMCIVLYIAAKRPTADSWTLTRENYNDTGTWPELTQSTGTPGSFM